VNLVGSSIARIRYAGAYTHAGPEIGVASTKAFTAQLAVLTMVALKIAKQKGTIDEERYMHLLQELHDIPDKIAEVLTTSEKIKKLAEKYIEPIPSQPEPPKVNTVEPPQTGERRVVIQKDVATPYLAVGWHVPEAKHEDYYALTLLGDILTSGRSSRLYSSLVDKQQLATSVFTNFGESFDPTLFAIAAVTAKNVKETDLENAIYAELQKIKKEGITEKELQKVKNQKLMEFYGQVETINGKSNNIGTYEVFFGDYKKMFDAPAAFNKVTADDIRKVVEKYFTKSNRTVGILKSNTEE